MWLVKVGLASTKVAGLAGPSDAKLAWVRREVPALADVPGFTSGEDLDGHRRT